MCLVIVVSRCHPELALAVGANRDEALDRPAVPMAVLRESGPRVLGGRDEVAGGTWFALNQHGVFATVTNRPPSPGPRPARRSRGELPLALAGHTTAASAVEAFAVTYRPRDFNPGWLLAGDRDTLFSIDMTEGDAPAVRPLPPGVHVLENLPYGAPSAKVAHVRALLGDVTGLPSAGVVARLQEVLRDHTMPAAGPGGEEPPVARPGLRAACVHAGGYGTRWAAVVSVPPARTEPPAIAYTDGPSCQHPYTDATPLW